MKAFIALSTFTALLGACSSAPSQPTPGSAAWISPDVDYSVTQDGVTHVLPNSAPRQTQTSTNFASDFTSLRVWASDRAGTTGFANLSGFAAAVGEQSTGAGAIAAGLDNGTYFAGASGPLSSTVPVTGTANYTGVYGFVVNGIDQLGDIALTADFDAGTLVDTSAGIDVNGTISGATIGGTVTVNGETGTLKGGIYNGFATTSVGGAAVGPNMAGIFIAR